MSGVDERYVLPKDSFAVGTTELSLQDERRPRHLGSRESGREIFIKIWYPSESLSDGHELLWASVRASAQKPLIVKLTLHFLRKIRVSAVPGLPCAELREMPVVIYHHGLISFAAENTSLVELLASQGMVVLGVEHRDQFEEYKSLQSGRSKEKKRQDRAVNKLLRKAAAEEKPTLFREYYRNAKITNAIVSGRAEDTLFVLDRLEEVLGRALNLSLVRCLKDSIHLVGFSLGGAVATEVAYSCYRAASVVNLDGGMFGSHIGGLLSVPYLMMYSGLSHGANNDLLPQNAECITPEGISHLNYLDIAMLFPVLRKLKVTGTVDGREFIQARNRTVTEFLNKQLPSSM